MPILLLPLLDGTVRHHHDNRTNGNMTEPAIQATAIDIVSCSGPDDLNDPSEVADLAAGVSLIEIGVQVSLRNVGTPNYPSRGWIDRFVLCMLEHAEGGLAASAALHVNGVWCRETCAGAMPPEVESLLEVESVYGPVFRRVQLNFDAGSDRIEASALAQVLGSLQARDITPILQDKPSNRALLDDLDARGAPFNVLFDMSGGFGVRAKSFPQPRAGRFNAWAGGLGPLTVSEDIPAIAGVAVGHASIGIDAQRMLRRDGRFDVRLAAAFASGASSWNALSQGFTLPRVPV